MPRPQIPKKKLAVRYALALRTLISIVDLTIMLVRDSIQVVVDRRIPDATPVDWSSTPPRADSGKSLSRVNTSNITSPTVDPRNAASDTIAILAARLGAASFSWRGYCAAAPVRRPPPKPAAPVPATFEQFSETSGPISVDGIDGDEGDLGDDIENPCSFGDTS